MIVWLAAALIGVAFLLLVFQRRQRLSPESVAQNEDEIIRVHSYDGLDALEDVLERADALTPHLLRQPAVWAATCGMLASIGMNGNFAMILGYSAVLGFVVWALFSVFDLAIPFVTISADTNRTGKDRYRKPEYVVVVGASVFASIVVGITALGAIGTRANNVDISARAQIAQARQDIVALNTEIQQLEKSIGGGSANKYEEMAAEADKAAEREGKRKYCGQKCEALKAKAVLLHAHADDAARRDALYKQRTQRLKDLDSLSKKQTNVGSVAQLVQNLTGIKNGEQTLIYALVVILMLFMIATPLLWKFGIDAAQEHRARHLQRAERKAYWRAMEVTNGSAWLQQKFGPEKLAEFVTAEDTPEPQTPPTNPTVAAEIAKALVDQNKAATQQLGARIDQLQAAMGEAPAPPPTEIIEKTVEAMPGMQNDEVAARIRQVIKAFPVDESITQEEFYHAYRQAGGQYPRSSFNNTASLVLKSFSDITVKEDGSFIKAA
jgi:hypothetical protein